MPLKKATIGCFFFFFFLVVIGLLNTTAGAIKLKNLATNPPSKPPNPNTMVQTHHWSIKTKSPCYNDNDTVSDDIGFMTTMTTSII